MSSDLSADQKRQKLAALLKEKLAAKDQKSISSVAGIAKPTLDEGIKTLQAQKDQLKSRNQDNPYFRVLEGMPSPEIICDGRRIINFANYNYLGLSGDQRVNDAAKAAVDQFGTSVGASRIASGERPIHGQLEKAIAQLVGQEDALAFVGGFGTNESVIGHICGAGDLILHDSLMHRSAIDGAMMSGARRIAYPHNDMVALEKILVQHRSNYRQCLILVEGLYSMDGDCVDLGAVVTLKERYEAMLFVDEAHSLGVLGKTGRGIAEHCGVAPEKIDIWMGTFSKALASCGGAIAGQHDLIEYLRYSTPGFVYSVGISPANAAAALASIKIMTAEQDRVTRVQKQGRLFYDLCEKAGFDTGPCEGFSVIPVILGSSEKAMALSNMLFAAGINAQPILYPAVAEEEARIRFFVTSEHSDEHIRFAICEIKKNISLL